MRDGLCPSSHSHRQRIAKMARWRRWEQGLARVAHRVRSYTMRALALLRGLMSVDFQPCDFPLVPRCRSAPCARLSRHDAKVNARLKMLALPLVASESVHCFSVKSSDGRSLVPHRSAMWELQRIIRRGRPSIPQLVLLAKRRRIHRWASRGRVERPLPHAPGDHRRDVRRMACRCGLPGRCPSRRLVVTTTFAQLQRRCLRHLELILVRAAWVDDPADCARTGQFVALDVLGELTASSNVTLLGYILARGPALASAIHACRLRRSHRCTQSCRAWIADLAHD